MFLPYETEVLRSYKLILKKMEAMHKDIQEIKARISNSNTNEPLNSDTAPLNGQPQTSSYPAVLKIDPRCSSEISSLFVMKDKRLAIGSLDQSITICSLDVERSSYTIDVKVAKAHENEINSICQLAERDDILVSSSDESKIKLWKVSRNELKNVRSFDKHSSYVFKVIPLTNSRCASCSADKSVKVWSASVDEDPAELASLSMHSEVRTILQLNSGRKELVASCEDKTIWFWNTETYTHVGTISGYYALEPYHMIEIPGMKIALSSDTEEHPIVIIDTQRYAIEKVIDLRNYNVEKSSSLCLLSSSSFIYARDKKLIHFDTGNYEVIGHTCALEKIDGDWDIAAIEEGKYFVIGNVSGGVTVFKNVKHGVE